MSSLICKKCHRTGVQAFLKTEAEAWNRKTVEQTKCICGESFDNVVSRKEMLKLWMGSDFCNEYATEFANVLIDAIGATKDFPTEQEMRTVLKYRWLQTFDEVPNNLIELATRVFVVKEELFEK